MWECLVNKTDEVLRKFTNELSSITCGCGKKVDTSMYVMLKLKKLVIK